MSWLDDMPERRLGLYAKRAFDIAVSGAGLVALSPLLAGVTVAEVIAHGWPPLFSQKRPGLHGRIFEMRKFRTMTNTRGPDGELLPDAERLTAFGQLLRSTSIDELPELVSVFVGDMSLVGPRPLLVQYLDRYSPEQMRRHEMPPGITGWAAVHGRNSLEWNERHALDVWYVDNWSLWLDARILAQTVSTVLRREGIAEEGQATMTEFMGPGHRA